MSTKSEGPREGLFVDLFFSWKSMSSSTLPSKLYESAGRKMELKSFPHRAFQGFLPPFCASKPQIEGLFNLLIKTNMFSALNFLFLFFVVLLFLIAKISSTSAIKLLLLTDFRRLYPFIHWRNCIQSKISSLVI